MERNYKEKLSGIFPPCMTIFDEHENVAYDKIAANIERYNQTKLRGYMPLGSNGEFRSLSDEESVKVIDVYQQYTPADKCLIAGVMRESAKATIEFIKRIADKRIDFATILAPHYFVSSMTDDALIKYYTVIADQSPIPIMLYNAPKFSAGLTFSQRIISELAVHPNIAGMKDTSSEDISVYINAVPEGANFYVMAGTINKLYKALEAGAVGGVVSMANYLPEPCCKLQELYEAGNIEEAQKLDVYLRELSSNAAGKFGVAGVKAAMDLLGYHGGAPRIPLLPLSEDKKAALKAVLEKEGLL
ncbi:dihydrodipicolinate synthetase [Candidatus Vecturithrix granuli]|uniref:Dihydrodipicolinate synthetase n=1 Tax=Vecturithrix granuli TaxID=1499967 RepID=A0A081BZ53_VECG1|nr:dihydrodipicolinate synthetase [Candidatus Vecturithrix granuli]